MSIVKRVLRVVALAAAVISQPSLGAIYKWVDSDGNTHFSQTPPPSVEQTNYPEVAEVNTSAYGGSGVTKRNGRLYCGDRRLPSSDDPIVQLSNIQYGMSNWGHSLQRQQKRRSELTLQRHSYDPNSSRYQSLNRRIAKADKSIRDLQCALSWGPKQSKKLQQARREFEATLQAARDDFKRYKNRCGPKPDIQGITRDPRALEWARCQNAGGTETHNRKLRRLKSLEARASALND